MLAYCHEGLFVPPPTPHDTALGHLLPIARSSMFNELASALRLAGLAEHWCEKLSRENRRTSPLPSSSNGPVSSSLLNAVESTARVALFGTSGIRPARRRRVKGPSCSCKSELPDSRRIVDRVARWALCVYLRVVLRTFIETVLCLNSKTTRVI